jgi:hypothetical protein
MSQATSFDTEKLTTEAEEIANRRLREMGIDSAQTEAPAQPVHAAQPAQPAQQAAPAQAESEPRKTRTTVAKLEKRYQERVESLNAEITKTERAIQVHQLQLQQLRCTLEVWQEALAEIAE